MFSVLLIAATLGVSYGKWTKEDYRITGFKNLPEPQEEMYSGYMPIHMRENTEGNFFFWMSMQRAARRKLGQQEQLVIWLNGGPGCSSMLGNLYENGPLTLKTAGNGSYSFESNPFSWNEVAHVVFVEQPVRVGYSQASSSTDKIKTEIQIARDFRGFMSSLLETFPELQGLPVTISGESYAGFYIPWISDHIIRRQLIGDYEDGRYKHINLQGAAIGNGAIDFVMMNPAYIEYMYTNSFIPLAAKEHLDAQWKECLDRAVYMGQPITTQSFARCGILEAVLDASGMPNMYNVDAGDYTPLWVTLSAFMNDPEVQTILHARGKTLPGLNFDPETRNAQVDKDGVFHPKLWQQCNDAITIAMRKDHPVSVVPAVAFIMKHMKVLMYSGSLDLSCNFLGTLHTLETNTWNGKPWWQAKRGLMKHENELVGMHYQLHNLTMLVVRGAGHLLPMDKPSAALEMLRRFLQDESFRDTPLPDEEYYIKAPIESARDIIEFDDTLEVPGDDVFDDDKSAADTKGSPGKKVDEKKTEHEDKNQQRQEDVGADDDEDDDDTGTAPATYNDNGDVQLASGPAAATITDTSEVQVNQQNGGIFSTTGLVMGVLLLAVVVVIRRTVRNNGHTAIINSILTQGANSHDTEYVSSDGVRSYQQGDFGL